MKTPSTSDYVRALRSVLPLSPVAMQILRAHYMCPGHRVTSRNLAAITGFKSWSATNVHYGRIAAKIGKALGGIWGKLHIALYAIADFVEREAQGNDELIFVMRPQLARAMEKLNLVRSPGDSGTLRLVTWNCRGGPAQKKLAAALSLQPDVLVMPEFPQVDLLVPGIMAWTGPRRRRSTKGIFAYAQSPYCLRVLRRRRNKDPREFMSVEIDGLCRFNMLAVWSKPDESSTAKTYVESIKRALSQHKRMFTDSCVPSVVIGDFNNSAIFSKSGAGYLEIERQLQNFGLVSAYHAANRERPGEESKQTFRHLGSNRGRYHIDYCFIPKRWAHRLWVDVGCPDAWRRLSDHAPLTIDISLS